MNVVSSCSFFLVIGLGADVVFVYTDTWSAAVLKPYSDADRIMWLYRKAGKASLVSSLTTSASFLANLASAVRPLREFGMFIGLCVMFAWVLVSLSFPPLCLAEHRYCTYCACRRKDTATSGAGTPAIASRWVRHLQGRWCIYVGLPLVLCGISVYLVCTMAESSGASPSMFPKDHNVNGLKQANRRFF